MSRTRTPRRPAATRPRAPAAAAPAAPRVTPEAQRFIAELARRQDRAWFSTRKDQLAALLHGPVEQILRETGARLIGAFPGVEDAVPKVFRIYRDVRFSKDKSPFKDHVGGTLGTGAFGVYFHVEGKDVFGAVGAYDMDPAQLKRYRAAVASSSLGPSLLAETGKLLRQGFELMSIDTLARAPAGVDAAHPCIELLKHKGYALVLPRPSKKALVDGSLPDLLAAQLKKARPALTLVDRAMAARG
ncbi:MAG: DUF2461 domain-containing protein [Deltaproteobacteria bacterium]|nr:DUF2461 domain-containing protein [Deltaproteobacteria bacterium]